MMEIKSQLIFSQRLRRQVAVINRAVDSTTAGNLNTVVGCIVIVDRFIKLLILIRLLLDLVFPSFLVPVGAEVDVQKKQQDAKDSHNQENRPILCIIRLGNSIDVGDVDSVVAAV